jgi:hypothetical protein
MNKLVELNASYFSGINDNEGIKNLNLNTLYAESNPKITKQSCSVSSFNIKY